MRRPGTKVDPVDIIAFCKERIAHYKCPRSVEIRDELPMSGPGKILKRELRAPFRRGDQPAVCRFVIDRDCNQAPWILGGLMMQTDRYGLALVVLAGAIVFAHLVWHPKCLILTNPPYQLRQLESSRHDSVPGSRRAADLGAKLTGQLLTFSRRQRRTPNWSTQTS